MQPEADKNGASDCIRTGLHLKTRVEAQGRRCACKYATASKELTMVGPGLGLARLLLSLLDVLLLLCVALL